MPKNISIQIRDYFQNLPGVSAALLYGSQAKGNPNKNSDIDIAILYDRNQEPSAVELWEHKNQLEDLLRKDVDLVCLNNIGVTLGSEIYENHVVILNRNPSKLEEYFERLLQDYAEVQELIGPLQERILERKYYDQA